MEFAVEMRVHTAGLDDLLKTVVVTGPVLARTAASLREAIEAAWLDPVPRLVLLDLSGVTALDPAGIRELLRADSQGELVVCRVSQLVRAALAATTAAELLRVPEAGEVLRNDPADSAITVHRGF
ncbi:STAS domain-containing protein [Amycolatopsis magusensis]|uniref:STAS domain-containing protein n=1 Tax=Amycolatopsis magusensis TaxID=882444 RepID=UPI0037A8015D